MARSQKPTQSTRFDRISDEEILAKWKSLLPKFIKGLAFFGSATLIIFVLNHFFTFSQRMTDIANVAFQIVCIFTACFLTLTAMGLYYVRGTWKQSPKSHP